MENFTTWAVLEVWAVCILTPDHTAHPEALGTFPVRVSSTNSSTVLGAVADAGEAGAGPCARVVGEVDQLHDGVVNAASSKGGVQVSNNQVQDIENKNVFEMHY